jgi:hypothetical protein
VHRVPPAKILTTQITARRMMGDRRDIIRGDGAGAGAAADAGAHSDYVGGAGGAGGAGGTSSAGAGAGAFAGVEGLVMVPDGLDGEGVSH